MHKKCIVISLVLALILLSTSITSAAAQEQHSRIVFACKVQGQGLISWGEPIIPGQPFGDIHIIKESNLIFAGKGEIEPTEIPGKETEYIAYILKEGTVKTLGFLSVKWSDNGYVRQILLVLESAKATNGVYVEEIGYWGTPGGPNPILTLMRTLGVGLSEETCLSFRGIYRSENKIKIISGFAGIGLFDFPEIHENALLLGIWINELETYVGFGWWSEEWQLLPPEELLTIPAADFRVMIELL